MKKIVKLSIVLVLFVIGVYCYQMRTSEAGINLIKSFEGCRTIAYQDAIGVWTIGYGHTIDVKEGMLITQHQCGVNIKRLWILILIYQWISLKNIILF